MKIPFSMSFVYLLLASSVSANWVGNIFQELLGKPARPPVATFSPWTTCKKFRDELNRTTSVVYFYGFDNGAGPHDIVDCFAFDHVARSHVEHIQLVEPFTGIKDFNIFTFKKLVDLLPNLRTVRYNHELNR
jgi:hypothetical protein